MCGGGSHRPAELEWTWADVVKASDAWALGCAAWLWDSGGRAGVRAPHSATGVRARQILMEWGGLLDQGSKMVYAV